MRLAVVLCALLLLPGLPPSPAPAATPADIDALTAPIALYPDSLLAQILLCAENPGKVAALNEWLASHQTLKGTDLQDAAVAAGFSESFAAIVLFPDVVHMMASQSDWTRRLGEAFVNDRSAVFDSIQRLRAKARAAGTLKSNAQQQVETKTTSGGQQVIVIEPANPQIVYVPQYNPQVVYAPASSTVVVQQDSSADAALAGVIGFTAGIVIGAAIDNDYYYGPYGWHGGGYMYNDAWDDYYDNREDAREDWQDHREDIVEDRSDRAKNAQEERTDRQGNRTSAESQAQRTERQQTRQTPEAQAQRDQRKADAQAAGAQPGAAKASQESRGYSGGASAKAPDRSGTKSDAFSGYSSGKSERAASQRGQKSRGSSRSGGGSRRK